VTSRARMSVAMRLGEPDRVPVMAQLGARPLLPQRRLDAVDVWHSTEAFTEALVRFSNGIVRWHSREPPGARPGVALAHRTRRPARSGAGHHLGATGGGRWRRRRQPARLRPDGNALPPDIPGGRSRGALLRRAARPPGPHVSQSWELDGAPADPGERFFPPGTWTPCAGSSRVQDTRCRCTAKSLALFAVPRTARLREGPACHDGRRGENEGLPGAADRGSDCPGRGLASAGADALLMSSAFAGAGFISRRHYSEFVLPFERAVIAGIKAHHDVPVYTHTCGAIGDRLDLMLATGTDGIDTLDPPPLGSVELATPSASSPTARSSRECRPGEHGVAWDTGDGARGRAGAYRPGRAGWAATC